MKKRIFLLTVLCVVLLLTLTGCSRAGSAVSSTVSKIKDDVSETMSRVESFFEGDDASSNMDGDTLSSRLDDDFTSSGTLDDDFTVSDSSGNDLTGSSGVTTKDVQ